MSLANVFFLALAGVTGGVDSESFRCGVPGLELVAAEAEGGTKTRRGANGSTNDVAS